MSKGFFTFAMAALLPTSAIGQESRPQPNVIIVIADYVGELSCLRKRVHVCHG